MYVNNNTPVQSPYTTHQQTRPSNVTQQIYSPYQTGDIYKASNSVYSLFSPQQSRFSPFYRPNLAQNNSQLQANTQQTNIQTTPNQTTQTQPQKNIPPLTPLDGPVEAGVQEKLQEEVKNIKDPKQALQAIEKYVALAIKERELTNDITWGARFYAMKAVELAQAQNIKTLPPEQQILVKKQIEEFRQKAVANLNEAKKHAILTYNSCLKATLIYNHFFTGQGSMVSVLDDQDRKLVENRINEGWLRWEKGFEKDFKGKKELALPAATVVDNTTKEVAQYFQQINDLLQ